MVLTVSFVLSPGTGLSCPRRRAIISRDLTSASGGQDHTPSPSAPTMLVSHHPRGHRIPASRFVTIAHTPLCIEAGRRHHASDFVKCQARFRKSECAGRDMMARRAVCAGRPCANCPSCTNDSTTRTVSPGADGKGGLVAWAGAIHRGFPNNEPARDLNDEAAISAVTGRYHGRSAVRMAADERLWTIYISAGACC